MRSNRPKVQIVEFCHDLIDPGILIAYTADGGRLRLTRVQDDFLPPHRSCHCPLYATPSKLFFTLYRGKLGQIFEAISLCSRTPGMACHNRKRGNSYPQLRNFGHVAVHLVILTTFRGPRPVFPDGKAAEGDHKNGDVMDFSLDNLEWVSKKENRRRSKVLKALRSIDINPTQVPYNILDVFLNPKIISDMSVLTTRLTQLRDLLGNLFVFPPADFRRWLSMPDPDFDAMISKYHRGKPLDCGAEPNKYFDHFIERDQLPTWPLFTPACSLSLGFTPKGNNPQKILLCITSSS